MLKECTYRLLEENCPFVSEDLFPFVSEDRLDRRLSLVGADSGGAFDFFEEPFFVDPVPLVAEDSDPSFVNRFCFCI
jgi:hypothetical protein